MKLSPAHLLAFGGVWGQLDLRTSQEIISTFVVVPDGYEGTFENWNTTEIVEENRDDELFQEFEFEYMSMTSGIGRIDFTDEEKAYIKKFKLMKHMILYLQRIPLFGKFCFYGCYCFAKGPKKLLIDAGNAKPMDQADNGCRKHGRCHKCAQFDFGAEKCEVTRPYRFSARQDPVTGNRFIQCLNEPGSCKRSICECDKALAYDLADAETAWNILHHERWGMFDQDLNCLRHSASPIRAAEDRSERLTDPVEGCCGEYPRRFPYHLDDGFGNVRRCCGGKTYNPLTLECCAAGNTAGIGTCSEI